MCGPFSQPQFPSLTSNAQGWLLRRSMKVEFHFSPNVQEPERDGAVQIQPLFAAQSKGLHGSQALRTNKPGSEVGCAFLVCPRSHLLCHC